MAGKVLCMRRMLKKGAQMWKPYPDNLQLSLLFASRKPVRKIANHDNLTTGCYNCHKCCSGLLSCGEEHLCIDPSDMSAAPIPEVGGLSDHHFCHCGLCIVFYRKLPFLEECSELTTSPKCNDRGNKSHVLEHSCNTIAPQFVRVASWLPVATQRAAYPSMKHSSIGLDYQINCLSLIVSAYPISWDRMGAFQIPSYYNNDICRDPESVLFRFQDLSFGTISSPKIV